MNADELEFQISQYAEGTLSPAETAALEVHLANDPAARGLVAEYRRLNEHLAGGFALPAMNWDRLAEHLSNVVAATDEQPIIAGRIAPGMAASGWSWRARLAVAASVIIAVGAGLFTLETHRHASEPQAAMASASAMVVGPQAEAATGPVIEDIKVGPSPALAARGESWRYAEGVVTRASVATIAGDVKPPSDGDWHIH